jgi:hypothetical protein
MLLMFALNVCLLHVDVFLIAGTSKSKVSVGDKPGTSGKTGRGSNVSVGDQPGTSGTSKKKPGPITPAIVVDSSDDDEPLPPPPSMSATEGDVTPVWKKKKGGGRAAAAKPAADVDKAVGSVAESVSSLLRGFDETAGKLVESTDERDAKFAQDFAKTLVQSLAEAREKEKEKKRAEKAARKAEKKRRKEAGGD